MKKLYTALFVVLMGATAVFALPEGMSVTKLPSGQKVVIKEVHDNPIVKIDTWINTGSINEDDKTTGISHFLEHLFFKGTKKYPTGTADKLLDSKGAIVNAATSKDFTHYYIELPSESFDLALDIHSDMLQNPLIPRKELERERGVVIEEISKCKDSPTTRMFDNMYSLLYSKSNHPYKREVIGKKEVIESVTREEILDYFNSFYTPDAYTTVIVGDVNKDETLSKVKAAFNQSKRKQKKIKYPIVKQLSQIERVEEKMDINKAYTMIGFLAPKFTIYKDNYALDVLAVMLADGKSSILNQKLKEEDNIVLSISAGNYSQKDSGLFYICASSEPKNEKKVEEAIIKELEKIKEGNFDNSQINKAKNQIKTDTYYSRESISNISDDIGYDFTFSPDENYWENYLKNIDKVTYDDILSAAKKYLLLDKYALSIVHPDGFIETADKKEVSKEENKILETKGNAQRTLLSNGATLTTKKKKTNSIIAIDIIIKGSLLAEKKPATALLASLSASRGTKNFTNTQLAQFLDENGIKLSISKSSDIFSIVMQTTKDNLDKALYVLDEVINNPIFSNDEIEKVRSRKIQELKAVSDSPSGYVFDEFKRLAFQNSIYGQNSTFILNNINNVKRDDIVEYYQRIMNPENMTIAVVGDIDENYLADKFNKIIKKNPKGQIFSFDNIKYNQYMPSKNIETTLEKKEVQANWMVLGYKTCGVKNRKDIAILNVIDAILGDGMSSRLFSKLREQQSLAYTVSSTNITGVLDGAFAAYIGTNSQSINKAKEGILLEIETIKKEMVTKKELDDAKDKIMGKFLLSLETNMDEASTLNWYSALGYGLDALDEYKTLIKNVSQADIIETANRYFNKPYIYTVVVEK